MAEDHTVVVESPSRGGGSGWIIALVLLVALVVGVVFFSRMAGTESAKDNAVAGAAQDVGQAARDAGAAARDAGAAAQDAANTPNK